jgi:hypothetical protein
MLTVVWDAGGGARRAAMALLAQNIPGRHAAL